MTQILGHVGLILHFALRCFAVWIGSSGRKAAVSQPSSKKSEDQYIMTDERWVEEAREELICVVNVTQASFSFSPIITSNFFACYGHDGTRSAV